MDKPIGAGEVNIDRMLDYLLERHLAAAKKTDFIVASLTPNSNLHKISEGKVESDLQSCWIGDHDAFSTYQEFFHQTRGLERPDLSPESAQIVNTIFRMKKAFARLVESGLHESVGQFVIEVATNPGEGFYYEAYYVGRPGPPSLRRRIEPSEEISDWSAAVGGFSTSILVPNNAGVGAIGIHFFQGKFGLSSTRPNTKSPLSLPKTPFRTAHRKIHSFCSRAIAFAASCIWSISQLAQSDRCGKTKTRGSCR